MQFQTPQFIDVEDQIFGPLTFKQFLYLVGGGGLSFVIFESLPSFFAILIIIPILGLSLSLAFVKINERPFIDTLEAAFNYMIRSKLYIWQKEKPKNTPAQEQKANISPEQSTAIPMPTLSQSKLKDMAWSLDVQKHMK